MKAKLILSIALILFFSAPLAAEVYWVDESPLQPIPRSQMTWSQPYGYGYSPYYMIPQGYAPEQHYPLYTSPVFGQRLSKPYQYPNYSYDNYYPYGYRNYRYNRNYPLYNYYYPGGLVRAQSPEFGEVYIPYEYVRNNRVNLYNYDQEQYYNERYNQNREYNQQRRATYPQEWDQALRYEPYRYDAPKTADQFNDWWNSPEYKQYLEDMKQSEENVDEQQGPPVPGKVEVKNPVEKQKKETEKEKEEKQVEKKKEEKKEKREWVEEKK